jgi:hypothetical protein
MLGLFNDLVDTVLVDLREAPERFLLGVLNLPLL